MKGRRGRATGCRKSTAVLVGRLGRQGCCARYCRDATVSLSSCRRLIGDGVVVAAESLTLDAACDEKEKG